MQHCFGTSGDFLKFIKNDMPNEHLRDLRALLDRETVAYYQRLDQKAKEISIRNYVRRRELEIAGDLDEEQRILDKIDTERCKLDEAKYDAATRASRVKYLKTLLTSLGETRESLARKKQSLACLEIMEVLPPELANIASAYVIARPGSSLLTEMLSITPISGNDS